MAALYGKLNMEMTPIRYTGKDTDTATVSVDNKNKTIEVSVKNVYTKEDIDNIVDELNNKIKILSDLIRV